MDPNSNLQFGNGRDGLEAKDDGSVRPCSGTTTETSADIIPVSDSQGNVTEPFTLHPGWFQGISSLDWSLQPYTLMVTWPKLYEKLEVLNPEENKIVQIQHLEEACFTYMLEENFNNTYLEKDSADEWGFFGSDPSNCAKNYWGALNRHFEVTGEKVKAIVIDPCTNELSDEAKSIRNGILYSKMWEVCPNLKYIRLEGFWNEDNEIIDVAAPASLPNNIELDVEISLTSKNVVKLIGVLSEALESLKITASLLVSCLKSGIEMKTLVKMTLIAPMEDNMMKMQEVFSGTPCLKELALCSTVVPTPQGIIKFINNVISKTDLKKLTLDKSFKEPRKESQYEDIGMLMPIDEVVLDWNRIDEFNIGLVKALDTARALKINVRFATEELTVMEEYAKSKSNIFISAPSKSNGNML